MKINMNKKNKEALVELLTGMHETLKAIHQRMANPAGEGEGVNEKIFPKQTRTLMKFVIHKAVNPEWHSKIDHPLVCGEDYKTRKAFCVSDVRPDAPTMRCYPPIDTEWMVDLPRYATSPIWVSKALFKSDGSWGGGYWSAPVRISQPVECIHITKQ